MSQEETHKQLRKNTLEMSEAMLMFFDNINTLRELEVFGKSHFGKIFSMFVRLTMTIEDRGLGEEDALKTAGKLYLEKIDARILEIKNAG